MAEALESSLEARLYRHCKRLGAECIRVERIGKGWPDRLIIARGHYIWVELKRNGGKVSADQRKIHARLRAAGAQVIVSRGSTGVTDVIAQVAQTMGVHDE